MMRLIKADGRLNQPVIRLRHAIPPRRCYQLSYQLARTSTQTRAVAGRRAESADGCP